MGHAQFFRKFKKKKQRNTTTTTTTNVNGTTVKHLAMQVLGSIHIFNNKFVENHAKEVREVLSRFPETAADVKKYSNVVKKYKAPRHNNNENEDDFSLEMNGFWTIPQ